MTKLKLTKEAVQTTNSEFYKLHPERKNRPLTNGAVDAKLRAEWLALYKKEIGSNSIKETTKILSAPVCGISGNERKVYVYVYVAAAGGHGHVGLIIEQKNGSYIRYSQAAENPNLQGWDRHEYLMWLQKVVVRKTVFPKFTKLKNLAPGSKIVRIPTKYPDSIQKAVDDYIADETHYNLVTNNCADFVNDTINAASDVNVSDKTIPTEYYSQLTVKFPDCEVSDK